MVANFSNRTGYAWNNIFRLYEEIGRAFGEQGWSRWVSFAELEAPVDEVDDSAVDGFLELSPSPRSIRECRAWRALLRRLNIRMLYLTDAPCWHWRYVWFRLAGVRTIVVHNRISVADPRVPAVDRGPRGWLKWLAGRFQPCAANRVYAVSAFVKQRLVNQARFPAEQVVTILNGIDLNRFRPTGAVQAGPVVKVFCASRAAAYKGIGTLIQSTALLKGRSDLPPFIVEYAGDGPDIERFKALAQSVGVVDVFRFLGRLSTTADHVREADIVVVPSTWGDACPSTISEALACGKPLVATRVGGVPEQVGVPPAAMLVDPGDAMVLAEAIAGLMLEPERRAQLALAARQRAEAALGLDRYHAQVLDQILEDSRIG